MVGKDGRRWMMGREGIVGYGEGRISRGWGLLVVKRC